MAEAAIKYPISKELVYHPEHRLQRLAWTLVVDNLFPREKKRKRTEFDLLEGVHEPEYDRIKKPPEPAHKLEVTLEEAEYTDEK